MQLTQNHINQILQNLNLGQIEKGLQLAKNLLNTNKDNLQLNKLVAYIYSMKEQNHLSIDILRKIKKKFPQDFDVSNNLGYNYLNEEKVSLALENINDAIKINPHDPTPYKNLAEIYLLLRNFDKAESAINLCLEKIAKQVNSSLHLSNIVRLKVQIFLAKNERVSAIDFLKINLNQNFDPELLFELVNVDRDTITNDILNKAKSLIKDNIYSSHLDRLNKLSPLLFFLAKYYEKNDQSLSEEYYNQANTEVKNIQRLKVIVFQKRFKSIMNSYNSIKDLERSSPQRGTGNLFIVGMPRSGTSLLESVVTANSQVFPGGELKAMNRLYDIFEESPNTNLIEKIDDMGREYSDITSEIKGAHDYIVDKMPLNATLIGFILKALPNAKIILILRNPWDIAISLYKQRYVQNITFAASFFNIGVYMANFEAIVNFWLNHPSIKNKIYKLKYEDLVNNFDLEQKSIYQFCEIISPYQQKVRESHFVRTASMNQVQGKIHKESIKKNAFENGHKEFLDAYYSQAEYWKSLGPSITYNFFGYFGQKG